ncbi:MAG: hypothetical protein ABSB88_10060 [Bryobacteraceae bacterium]|jgi:hypothetical protein
MQLRRTLLFCLAVTGVMMAADSPFVGKWKLNTAKSKFTGMTTTYEALPTGEMQATSEGQSYKFKVDGKEYPTAFGAGATWKQLDPTSWETTYRLDGKVLSVGTTRISADGKTMTVTAKGTKPNGEAFNDSTTLQRISGGPGLAGKWKSTEVKSSTEMWEITPNGDDGLTMKIVDFDAICTMKFDGKDYPATGPTVPKNFTLAVKKTGARSLEMTEKVGGKVVFVDSFAVSADGKTLTDDGVPAGTTEKVKAVYDKQ